MNDKIRIVISGIGNRALPKNPEDSSWLGWVELIKRSDNFQLVAAHDTSESSIKRIIDRGYLKPTQTYIDLDTMLGEVKCDAILISNPAKYHGVTIKKALDFNLHLLIEKPFVNNLDEGKKIIEFIEKKGRAASVIQNWRCKDVGRLLYNAIQTNMLGKIGHIFFRYVRNRENLNYPSYIFDEKYPLLYAMSIHHLDLFRYILKDEYISVKGSSFKPPWSLYKSDTGVNLFLKTRNGVTIIYSGTISSKNSSFPQESLVIEGEKGTLVNESQWLEPPLWFYSNEKKGRTDLTQDIGNRSIAEQYNISDEYILNDFYRAIRREKKPICTAKDAFRSVEILEASRLACETGKAVYVNQILG